MKEIINDILDESKIAYRESILINNKILEDNLLSIMSNIKYLQKEIENFKLKKKNKKGLDTEIEINEIEKVKRKVPLWLNKKTQYNYKILKTFMDLSNNNSHYVNVTTLESHCGINDSKKFLSNYNLLKTISEKNHAKVFQEKNGQIHLWSPISEIVVNYFE
jgi:cell fate (sporulation/competence/biofilm development) regulator YmcA (YheA/YmcA/DUF963 family)